MLKICGEPESPTEKACLSYIFELANNIHIRDRSSGPSNSESVQSRTFKHSNSQTFELQTRWTFELSISTRFKPSNFANYQSVELSNSRTFIPFKQSISETFKPSNWKPFEVLKSSNSQTRDLSHKPQIKSEANLSNSKLSNFQTVDLSNLQAFELSNFRTFEPWNFQTLQPSNLRKCKLSKSQTLKLRRPIELDRGKSLKFEFEAAFRARKFES